MKSEPRTIDNLLRSLLFGLSVKILKFTVKHIHIPNNKDILRGWAHGPLTGNISIENNQYIDQYKKHIPRNL